MTEHDPTAIDPDEEEELPAKPPVDHVPEEGAPAPTDQEEHDIEQRGTAFLPADEAAADATVDDEEQQQPRHAALPEGASREDYDD